MMQFLAATLAILAVNTTAQAQLSFNTVTTSPTQGAYNNGTWYTDRYAPAAFQNTTWQSRSNVLQIGINESGNRANRGASFSTDFYATQGRKYDLGPVNTGRFSLFADLWVDQSWANAQNGFRRTDMWAVGSSGVENTNVNTGAITAYPIIGFTNRESGTSPFAGFRFWNGGGWTNTSATVNYGAWNTLGITLDVGNDMFSYFVNGSLVGSFGANGTQFMDAAIMQAFNFSNDFASLGTNNGTAYDAYWANPTSVSVVPEPASIALLAAGLGMLAMTSRRRRQLQI